MTVPFHLTINNLFMKCSYKFVYTATLAEYVPFI